MSVRDRNVDALRKLIADAIAREPHERGGFQWAAIPQPVICEALGISPATLRRIISEPPFVRERGQIDGVNFTLLREGDPGKMTPRHMANTMSKMLRDYRRKTRLALVAEREMLAAGLTGKDADTVAELRMEKLDALLEKMPDLTTRHEYGCLHGLIEVWPADYQVAIFGSVLRDWDAYMAGQKIEIWLSDSDRELYFEFASVEVLRRYPQPAVELFVMERQEKATSLTPELRKLSESIFTHK